MSEIDVSSLESTIFLEDYPENGNPYFDPSQNLGVPQQYVRKKQLNLNDEFERNAGNNVKSLLKINDIYSLEEETEDETG